MLYDEMECAVSKVCQLSGKKIQYGNNVSHANNKTKRRFMPNLQHVSFVSDALGMRVRARLSTSAVRSVEKIGGIDAYLCDVPIGVLSPRFQRLKKLLTTKLASQNMPISL
jgi:large subunit ribosomal protein L28